MMTTKELVETPLSGASSLSSEIATLEKPARRPSKATLKKQATQRADDIRARLDATTEHIETIPVLVSEAWEDGDWQALGHPNWEAYVAVEFGTSLLKLDKAIRKLWVKELTSHGMSQREIAPVVNVSQMTVSRDLDETNDSPKTPAPLPEGDTVVIGRDGLVILGDEEPEKPSKSQPDPVSKWGLVPGLIDAWEGVADKYLALDEVT